MIYILTGAIRTGKTTALSNWTKNRTDVDGLLCPDGENGKRYFLKIKSNDGFPLEVEFGSDNVITVGKFHFLESAFEDANSYLTLTSEVDNQYLIIDELGKLELKNRGLYLSAKTIIPKFKFNKTQHLILIVRDYLLTEVIQHFSIVNHKIINIEDLKTIN